MSYYDNTEFYTARGIDFDLNACLENNGQSQYTIENILKVEAVVEGERDAADWHWILKLDTPVAGCHYVYLCGGCDYTGWDCQSRASSFYAKTKSDAIEFAKPKQGDWNYEEQSGAYASLLKQIQSKKKKTWREANDKGVKPIQALPNSQE